MSSTKHADTNFTQLFAP